MLGALNEVPRELSKVYEQELARIDDWDVAFATRVFQWTCLTSHPVSITAVRIAVCLDEQSTASPTEGFTASRNWCPSDESFEKRVHRACLGLIRRNDRWHPRFKLDANCKLAILPYYPFLVCAHDTIRDFMVRDGINSLQSRAPGNVNSSSKASMNIALARECFRLLTCSEARLWVRGWIKGFEQSSQRKGSVKVEIKNEFPMFSMFALSANKVWIEQLQVALREGSDLSEVLKFLTGVSPDEWRQVSILTIITKKASASNSGDTLTGSFHFDLSKANWCNLWHFLCHMGGSGSESLVDALTSQRDPATRELIVGSKFLENPDVQNDYGMTALMLATLQGHEKIADMLLSYGVEVNRVNHEGDTALSIALTWGQRDIALKILGVPSVEVDTFNRASDSPLCLAAMDYLEVDLDVLKMLLGRSKIGPHSHAHAFLLSCDKSFFRESQSRWEDNEVLRTPLTKAIVYGTTKVVQTMLDSPLITPDVGSSSESLFHSLSVRQEQDVGIIDLQVVEQDVWFKNVQVVLHDGRFPLDTKNMYGNTPLAKAARNGDWPLVKILLASGKVTIATVNNDAYTPLMEAIHAPKQQPLIVYSLLQTNQVDAWRTNPLGSSAFTFAQEAAASDEPEASDIARRRKLVSELVTAYAENRPLEVAYARPPDSEVELKDYRSKNRRSIRYSPSDIDLPEDKTAAMFTINRMFGDYKPEFVLKVLRELYPRKVIQGSGVEEE